MHNFDIDCEEISLFEVHNLFTMLCRRISFVQFGNGNCCMLQIYKKMSTRIVRVSHPTTGPNIRTPSILLDLNWLYWSQQHTVTWMLNCYYCRLERGGASGSSSARRSLCSVWPGSCSSSAWSSSLAATSGPSPCTGSPCPRLSTESRWPSVAGCNAGQSSNTCVYFKIL